MCLVRGTMHSLLCFQINLTHKSMTWRNHGKKNVLLKASMLCFFPPSFICYPHIRFCLSFWNSPFIKGWGLIYGSIVLLFCKEERALQIFGVFAKYMHFVAGWKVGQGKCIVLTLGYKGKHRLCLFFAIWSKTERNQEHCYSCEGHQHLETCTLLTINF